MKSKLVLIILSILFIACSGEDKCLERIDGPDYLLSQNSKSYVSFFEGIDNVIFKNIQTDEEEKFQLGNFNQLSGSYLGAIVCDEDPSLFSTVAGVSEYIEFTLSNMQLDDPIIFRLNADPEILTKNEINEYLLIQYGDFFSPLTESEHLIFHFPEDPLLHNIKHDSLMIGNKVFYDVFEIDPLDPGFDQGFDAQLEIKITKNEGIVYINDLINNRELVFDRIE